MALPGGRSIGGGSGCPPRPACPTMVVTAVTHIALNAKRKIRFRRHADVMKPPICDGPGPQDSASKWLSTSERIVHRKLHVSPWKKRQRGRIARSRRHAPKARARLRRDRGD